MSLLNDILQNKKQEVEAHKKALPLRELKDRAKHFKVRSFKHALTYDGFGIIGEVKKKSPSMSDMSMKNVEKALSVYEKHDLIRAVSILTDQRYFGGKLEDLTEARKITNKPLLRKDFILDEYQVWEAKAFGADAILLMSSVHSDDSKKFKALFELATELELDVLIEFGMDTQPSKEFIPKGSSIFGINSRRFKEIEKMKYKASKLFLSRVMKKDITTDLQIHLNLFDKMSELVPGKKVMVAESGIGKPKDLEPLMEKGFKVALIGTGFLKHNDVEETVEDFYSFVKNHKTVLSEKLHHAY